MQTHSILLEIKNTKNKICANKKIKYMLANIYIKYPASILKLCFQGKFNDLGKHSFTVILTEKN